MNGKVYIIRNRINDKVYVGQTTRTIQARFAEHMNPKNQSHGDKFHNAIFQHGAENFYIELLQDNIPEDLLDDAERYWIAEFNSFYNGYNTLPGGHGEGMVYISDKMLKDWGVYEAFQELKTVPINESRWIELQRFIIGRLSELFPDFAGYYDDLMVKFECAHAGVECKFV